MTSITTMCKVCGRLARNMCSLCGKAVCNNHYDSKTGLCITCLAGRKIAT